jgi:hypothetical protein
MKMSGRYPGNVTLTDDAADELRAAVVALMTCSCCGHTCTSLSEVARRAKVAKSALWLFLDGSTAGSHMAAQLRLLLDTERPFGYNQPDGSSVKSNSIAPDTRSPATTRSAGVTASIGVVDR